MLEHQINEKRATPKAKSILAEERVTSETTDIHLAVTLCKRLKEVFVFCADLGNIESFLKDSEVVKTESQKAVIIKFKGAENAKTEFKLTLTEVTPDRMLGWKLQENSETELTGSIWFRSVQNGETVISLAVDKIDSPTTLSKISAKVLGLANVEKVRINLQRLKALLETGEIPTIEGQPSGREKIEEADSVKH